MTGSCHLSFFVFRQFWGRSYESQLSFSGKGSAADFFVFRHFHQNTKIVVNRTLVTYITCKSSGAGWAWWSFAHLVFVEPNSSSSYPRSYWMSPYLLENLFQLVRASEFWSKKQTTSEVWSKKPIDLSDVILRLLSGSSHIQNVSKLEIVVKLYLFLNTLAQSICTLIFNFSGQPDIFLGSWTLKKSGTLLFTKKQGAKNRVIVIQKEKRPGCLFSFE